MSQQEYPWPCEYCGTVHRFTADDVGAKVMCGCANLVVVPEVNILRAAVPEEEVSPDFALTEAARLGRLPFETRCAVCGRATAEVVTLGVECRGSRDRATAEALVRVGSWFMGVGFLYHIASEVMGEEEDSGRRSISLPVRACGGCQSRLLEARAAAAAILKTPLYVRLLAQFRRVWVVSAGGTPVVYPTTPAYNSTRRARRVAIGWVLGLVSTPLVTFALIVAISWILAGTKVLEWPMGMIFIGSQLLSIVIGTLIGHTFGRWHLKRWPETADPS